MMPIFQMAMKDIKLITRDRLGLFFIVGFPILMGLFFGLVMSQGGSSGGSSAMKVALIDQDQTEISQQFADSLASNESLAFQDIDLDEARQSVRKGNLIAVMVLPKGFGDQAGVVFGEPPVIQMGIDPARNAEAAMLEGYVMQSIGDLVAQRFQNPSQFKPMLENSREQIDANPDISLIQRTMLKTFLNSVETMIDSADQVQQDSNDGGPLSGGIQFADIQNLDIFDTDDSGGGNSNDDGSSDSGPSLKSQWDISFPQAMMWGVLGCVAGFAISIARERSMGTLMRLQVAPVNRMSILFGKALACFITVLCVIALLTLIGWLLGLKLNLNSVIKLSVASVCVAFCFVGIMMVMSVLGKTEQGVSGAGWGMNMVMAMLGGCMIPTMFMPGFLQTLSVISPVRWGIQSIEGAIWREFTWMEMSWPCVILIGFGSLGMIIGGAILAKQTD